MTDKKLTIDIHNVRGFSVSQEKKYREAADLAIEIINSEEFKRRVLYFNYSYRGEIHTSFKHSKGKSNAEIYHELMAGGDKFSSPDGDMDVDATMYFSRKRVIGYTFPNTLRTWVNKKYFLSFSKSRVAGNIVHEYLHNLNYGHARKSNSTRKFTVPYAIGYIVRDIAKELEDPSDNSIPLPKEKKKRVCVGKWVFKRCWYE